MDESIIQEIQDNRDVLFGIPEDEFLFTTVVGSHMWGMEHEGSDIDLFIVRRAPTRDILIGTDVNKTVRDKIQINGTDVEYDIHEVGKVINMLIRNNPNFIWGVTSPVFLDGNKIIYENMKELAQLLISKEIYKPIRGMIIHNTDKYIASGKDPSEKRCNTIARAALFGINTLIHKSFKYKPVKGFTKDDILRLPDDLEIALEESKLPTKPEAFAIKIAEEWLYEIRLEGIGDRND